MTLDVYLNGIESVECLPRISLPSLKKLFISRNVKIQMKTESLLYGPLSKEAGHSWNK